VTTPPTAVADVVIVGAGLSGLTAAFEVLRRRASARVVVVEASDRAGGVIATDHVDGFTVDHAPGGFLANAPATLELVDALGLTSALRSADASAQRRYLLKGGRLHSVPTSPLAFATSPLLSARARARVLLEPFVPSRPPLDESVHAFVSRRLGEEFATTLVGAMVRGITAGDARQTSLPALFPTMRRMEVEHGSLVRALLQRRRRAGGAGPGGPGGRLTTFRDGGMGRLPATLAAALGDRLRLRTTVTGITRREAGFEVATADGEVVASRAVVVATPAAAAARLLAGVAPDAAAPLADIPYAGVRMLALGYHRRDVPSPCTGFGFLVPPGEPSRLLGVLFTSSTFPEQAPDGHLLVRALAGGVGDPEMVRVDDARALTIVREELGRILGLSAAPVMVRQIVWERAIPQYVLGHQERLARVEGALGHVPGLFLAGNAYRGVGVNDAVRDGLMAAHAAVAHLEIGTGTATA
jgi:protoporphyrinogen/coproporphyrinogen III oxidase